MKTLAELALLNMRVQDIIYPNELIFPPPPDSYMITDIIFRIGKNLFMEELGIRNFIYWNQWIDSNRHYCAVRKSDASGCWCGCDQNEDYCMCSCFLCFHLLLEEIMYEIGIVNYNAPLKYVLLRI